MDPKGEDSSSSSGDSLSPTAHQNGTKDEPVGLEPGNKEVEKESAEGSRVTAENGETKVDVKVEDLSDDDDDDDFKSCEGDLDDEREEEKEVETPREQPHPPKSRNEEEVDSEPETPHRRTRDQKWSEALKAKLFASVDKDSNIFSYMFLDKIFGEARPCKFCGARGTAKLPPGDDSLKLFVLEDGIIGKQNILCSRCVKLDTVISCDDVSRLPTDDRLSITGADIRYYCRNVTHYEILHDLMEMLHIAATDDDSQRQEKHHEVADFMLKNVRKVCEEWCRPEYAELRLKKYLRLRDETLLTTYNPTFTPDCTEEYKEMYEMMANSFRQNRDKVLLLLQLMKESLIDSPTRSTFMMWVSIAMMHSESYSQFKTAYDPRSFMRVDSSEYQALQDRYLALEVPLGIKKIPVIFILFEIPRFYHYVEFLNQRIGKKKSRTYLTDEEREMLQNIEEETIKMGLKMKPRTGKMVSPEAHLDFLTKHEEYEREKIYQSCRDKEKAKKQKLQNDLKVATSVKGQLPSSSSSSSYGSSSNSSTHKKTEASKASSSTSSSSSGFYVHDLSKPVANKKKRRKAKQEKLAEAEASLSTEEKARRKAIEDATRRKKEEFISRDAFHTILRETLEASEATKVVIKEKKEEPEEDKQKQRLRRKLKKREEEREREKFLKERREREQMFKEVKEKEHALRDRREKRAKEQALREKKEEGQAMKEEKMSKQASEEKEKEQDLEVEKEEQAVKETREREQAVNEEREKETALMEEKEREQALEEKRKKEKALMEEKEREQALEEKRKKEKALMEEKEREQALEEKREEDTALMVEKEREQALEEKRDKEQVLKEAKEEEKISQEPEKAVESKKQPPKVEEKSPLEEERNCVHEETKPAKEEQKEPLKDDSKSEKEKEKMAAVESEDKKASQGEKPTSGDKEGISSNEEETAVKVEDEKASEDKEKMVLTSEEKEIMKVEEDNLSEKKQEAVSKMETEEEETVSNDQEKREDGSCKESVADDERGEGKGSNDDNVENEESSTDAASQLPKATKPEVSPNSPLANIPLPPRPGADPDQKPINPPSMEPTSTPSSKHTTRSSSRKELREQVKVSSNRQKNAGTDTMTVLCAQVDTELLRAQGYKISGNAPVSTVVANSDGTIEHILDGLTTPEQVKTFLTKRYSLLEQQAGPGYLAVAHKGDPGALVDDPIVTKGVDCDPKQPGNPKKRKKARSAQQESTTSSTIDPHHRLPGEWKGTLGVPDGPNRVLDKSMCRALGGGSLTKALSVAYKGAMAQTQYKDEDELLEDDENGFVGIGSCKSDPDGTGSISEISDKSESEPTSTNGRGSKSPKDGSCSSLRDSDKPVVGNSDLSGSGKSGSNDAGSEGSGRGTGSGSGSSAVGKNRDGDKREGDKISKAIEKVKRGSGIIDNLPRMSKDGEWIVKMGNESAIIHTDETKEVVISRGDEWITLKPIGKAYMRNWSRGKKELFRRHQCKGLDEKIYYVDTDAEAKHVFMEAMKPCDLGPLEGPCPRYVVPSSGGKIKFPDYFEDMINIEDMSDYIKSYAAPRQQMALMDAMSFPYKLETTKVFITRRNRDGVEIPGPPKVAIVSKITMLPKELAHKKVEVLDHGLLLQLIDSDDEEAELLKELEPPTRRKEIEAPPTRKEIEAPPTRKAIEAPPPPPPKKRDVDPPPKKNEPSPKTRISTAGLTLNDTREDGAANTLTQLIAQTLATKTRLRDMPISMDNLSETVMDVLKDMSTEDLLAHLQNDEELAITLPPRESKESSAAGGRPSRRKTNDRSGKELREKLAAKHSANKLAKEREAALVSHDQGSTSADTTVTSSTTSQSKKKRVKKKPKKVENQTTVFKEETASTLMIPKPSDRKLAADETPISLNGMELGGGRKPEPEPEPEPVREIDDIDDIDVGVSEDLLKGGRVGVLTSGDHASSTIPMTTSGSETGAAKSSQSKVAAREKFRSCDCCGLEIEDRILVCSSCKKVAYCNRQCQKAHWKAHKKTCSPKNVSKDDCTG